MALILILQDIMLDSLLCSVCEKYLSALPVKVYPNDITKCGRCSDKNDEGILSTYNNVVGNYLFKCINRYDGCNKLLTSADVLLHEKLCISTSYKCPKCEPEKSSTAYELLRHYKSQHPDSILKKNIFYISGRHILKERYLYLVQDHIFFILVENMPHEKTLYLTAVSLISNANVMQQFSVNLIGQRMVNIKTERTRCVSLEGFKCDYYIIQHKCLNLRKISCVVDLDLSRNINYVNEIILASTETTEELQDETNGNSREVSLQTIPLENIFGVKLPDEFREEYPGYKLTPCGTALFKDSKRLELTCSNCKQFTGCNVFNCKFDKHVVCWECKAWCRICEAPIDGWNADNASVNELLLLPCKWKCGLNFSGNALRNHEKTCYKWMCPIKSCYISDMTFLCLKDHLKKNHNTELTDGINLTEYLSKIGKRSGSIYVLQNSYLFEMTWGKLINSCKIRLDPCKNVKDYELAVVLDNKIYKKFINNEIRCNFSQNPKLYLKML